MKRFAPVRILIARAGIGFLITVAVLAGVRLAFFSGPFRRVQTPAPPPLVDLHVHTAGIGGGGSGCFVSPELQRSYKFGLYLEAFGVTREELDRDGDALLIRRISEKLTSSSQVGVAVVLALDGAVNAAGDLDSGQTEILVPNEFVARETARYTNLWFGASINPYRRDALERLDWAVTNGAVLVKWIPSIMQIDPSDERLVPFYQRMKAHGLPLLTHAGQERSFTRANDALSDPERLRLPLRLGVTVIAAHIASTGVNGGEPDVDRLARLMAEFPNLYSEISSLTQVNKLGYLNQALARPEFFGRLCYGSDFPLINTALVSPWYFPLQLTMTQMQALDNISNPWDRDVRLKQALGVPSDVFARTRDLLKPSRFGALSAPGLSTR